DAEIVLEAPEAAARVLRLEIEPGPAIGLGPFDLHVLDGSDQVVARGLIRRRQVIELMLPLCPGRTHVFTLHAEPLEPPAAGDARAPAFRLLRCGWAREPLDVLNPELGLAVGAGWSALELEGGVPFRRVYDGAELLVQAGLAPGRVIDIDLEAE